MARRQALRHLLVLSQSFNSACSTSTPLLHKAGPSAATAAVHAGTYSSARQWHWQTSLRYQSTSASVQQLLDGVSATQLRDALADEAEVRPFMTNPELEQFIISQKAANSEAEAQARADVLVKAGVVLRFNGMVYLRPQEVSEVVYRLLPSDPASAQQNLATVEHELAIMEKQHRQIYTQAQRWARRWLVAGCAVLATQLVAFAYLTWWELSWDVMEPVAYILSLSYSLLAYIYFLYTRGSYFEQRDFQEYWQQQLLEKRMAAAGFDLDKYQHLMRTRERYKRYMTARGAEGHSMLEASQELHSAAKHKES